MYWQVNLSIALSNFKSITFSLHPCPVKHFCAALYAQCWAASTVAPVLPLKRLLIVYDESHDLLDHDLLDHGGQKASDIRVGDEPWVAAKKADSIFAEGIAAHYAECLFQVPKNVSQKVKNCLI